MNDKLPVTMKDVAQAAGMHVSTVSLALRGSPRIAQGTRERIADIAQRMGYHPNPLVTALMKNRRSPVAKRPVLSAGYLSFEELSPVLREEPIYAEYERGAFAEAERQGLHLEKFKVTTKMSQCRIDEIMAARGITAVLVSPLPPEMHTAALTWKNLSAIAIGPTLREPLLHQVMSHYFDNMSLLLRACVEWGYRRPGLCLDMASDERVGGQWEASFLRFQSIKNQIERVETFKYDTLKPRAFKAWLKRGKPDIILCPRATEIQAALKTFGLRMPEDIALASVSAARPGGWLSGIVEDGLSAGAQAVTQLLRMIYTNERGIPTHPLKILFSARVYKGGSTQ